MNVWTSISQSLTPAGPEAITSGSISLFKQSRLSRGVSRSVATESRGSSPSSRMYV